MKKLISILIFLTLMLCSCKAPVKVENKNWEVIEEAYVYLFPLVLMDATKTSATNVEEPDGAGHAPVNQLIHSQSLANDEFKMVVTPNVDTLYTQAWVDLSEEPMIYRMPKSDRFFNVQILDAWTNTSDVLKEPGDYALVKTGWNGELPANVTRVDVPTNTAWMICRMVVDDEKDINRVKGIQSNMKLVPLSSYNSINDYNPPRGKYDKVNDFVPVQKVLSMTPKEFFDSANNLMLFNPPSTEDAEMVVKLASVGIGPGLTFDNSFLPENFATKWSDMLKNLKEKLFAEASKYTIPLGDWRYFGKPIGDFGNAYMYRAAIALGGLGANTIDVAIYPKVDNDHNGEALNGAKEYVIHMESAPPVLKDGFWSITAYGQDDFLIKNPINRYCINDRSKCKYNEDGSLDIIVSKESQDSNMENWLPVGEGEFHLYMRIYYPDMNEISNWKPPVINAK